jgi:hypothetical protein
VKVFYVDIGQLPKTAAEAHFTEYVKKINDQKVLAQGTTLFIPVRGPDDQTRLEIIGE